MNGAFRMSGGIVWLSLGLFTYLLNDAGYDNLFANIWTFCFTTRLRATTARAFSNAPERTYYLPTYDLDGRCYVGLRISSIAPPPPFSTYRPPPTPALPGMTAAYRAPAVPRSLPH